MQLWSFTLLLSRCVTICRSASNDFGDLSTTQNWRSFEKLKKYQEKERERNLWLVNLVGLSIFDCEDISNTVFHRISPLLRLSARFSRISSQWACWLEALKIYQFTAQSAINPENVIKQYQALCCKILVFFYFMFWRMSNSIQWKTYAIS